MKEVDLTQVWKKACADSRFQNKKSKGFNPNWYAFDIGEYRLNLCAADNQYTKCRLQYGELIQLIPNSTFLTLSELFTQEKINKDKYIDILKNHDLL